MKVHVHPKATPLLSAADAPLISVITVALNAAATLQRTISSVLNQDYPRTEYIVIDGGSTDGTEEILRACEARLGRLLVEPDDGIADAMNKGLALAGGDFVLFVHADDRLAGSDALSRAAARITQDPTADIYAGCIELDQDSGSRRICRRRLLASLNVKQSVPHQAALCRRRLFDELGGFDTSLAIAMDYEFFLRAYRARKTIRAIPEVICEMGSHGLSSQLDAHSLVARFAEERQVHQRHATGRWLKSFYALYWTLYPRYRGWRQFGDADALLGTQHGS